MGTRLRYLDIYGKNGETIYSALEHWNEASAKWKSVRAIRISYKEEEEYRYDKDKF